MAGKMSAKARQKRRKKLFYRIVTITIVTVMAGSILLATLLSRLY